MRHSPVSDLVLRIPGRRAGQNTLIRHQRTAIRTRLRRAFSLVEAIVSTVIVGVMLVAALNTVAAAKLGAQRTGDRAKGTLLAQELMSEILRQSYEDPTETVAFGREAAELGTTRAGYDDVDDYHGWSASPPQYKDGTTIPNLEGWARRVSVGRVSAVNMALDGSVETGVKLITVTVSRDGLDVGSLTAVRAQARDDMEN